MDQKMINWVAKMIKWKIAVIMICEISLSLRAQNIIINNRGKTLVIKKSKKRYTKKQLPPRRILCNLGTVLMDQKMINWVAKMIKWKIAVIMICEISLSLRAQNIIINNRDKTLLIKKPIAPTQDRTTDLQFTRLTLYH
jgi:hypothetical protein